MTTPNSSSDQGSALSTLGWVGIVIVCAFAALIVLRLLGSSGAN